MRPCPLQAYGYTLKPISYKDTFAKSVLCIGGFDLAETELERAEKRYAQAKARLQGLRNREAVKQRKLDTRRKVILGGALLDLAERDDTAAQMVDRLIRNLPREHDQKAFDGWEGASPSDTTSPSLPSEAGNTE